MSPEIRHLVVGPQTHGVVRHGLGLHAAAAATRAGGVEHRLLRVRSVAELESAAQLDGGAQLAAAPAPSRPSGSRGASDDGRAASDAAGSAVPILHVSFTDALFGADPEVAVDAVLRLRAGHLLSVGPHDVPQPEEGAQRFERRRRAYRRLVQGADLVIAHSEHEAVQLRALAAEDPSEDAAAAAAGGADGGEARDRAGAAARAPIPVRVVPLPLEEPLGGSVEGGAEAPAAPAPEAAAGAGVVGVLGFVYPGKGYEDVIDGAPAGTVIRAIGGIATGHETDAEALRERAARRGVGFEITGYVPEEELAGQLAAADVPVCPHRHVSASGSLSTWIAHGRIPVVVDGPYMREIDERWPGSVLRCERGQLGEVLADLLADPSRTRAQQDLPRWGWSEVADAYAEAWTELLP